MVVRRSFDAATLTRLRAMPLSVALEFLSVHAKTDTTYLPLKDKHSRRWHVKTLRGEFEILITGSKWYDTRAQIGGGGSIDLAMHLLGLSFVDAVTHLAANEGQHGPNHS
nr:hypothetical protein [Paraburkholderia sp. PGU16]